MRHPCDLGIRIQYRRKKRGSRGGRGRDEPTNSELELSYFKEEEEDEEEEEMVDQNLEWITQGPLALPSVLHKIPKRVERMNINFNPGSTMKVEDHLDKFYLHLQTLEVWYDDVACRFFPCNLDVCIASWYHNIPTNTIYKWGAFKRMFLENFIDEKTPSMLLKEFGSLKMEGKEKVKDFNQRFTHILNNFVVDTKSHDSIIVDYYTFSLLTSVAQFTKRATKPTLL